MKKLIASLLTVATVASMASMSAFAAPATNAVISIDLTGVKATAAAAVAVKYDTTTIVTTAALAADDDCDTIGAAVLAATATGYTAAYDVDSDVLTLTSTSAGATTLATSKVSLTNVTGTPDVSITDGKADSGIDAGKVALEDAILCDGNGNPIALVEDGDNNDSDGVKTGKSVYFMVQAPYNDDDYFKVDVKKADGSKNISKISTVDKNFSKDLVIAGTKNVQTGTSGRKTFVKVELKELYTDSENKINFDMTVKCKKAYKVNSTVSLASGDSVKFENVGQFYMKNSKDETDDVTYSAGTKGVVVKPIKNEENTVEWEDNNDTIAKLTFEADSDVNAYYPKLSTKWADSDYAENFAGTDAFIRSFVGAPTISSTSRPVLEFYNPFVDEDDEETVAPEDVVIYEVVDGALVDVTAKFTIGDNDDGDSVFTIKTRTLGTYIFSNGAATAAEEAPAEEAPSDVKENPGTGRF